MALLGQDTHDLRIMQTYPKSFRAWFTPYALTAPVDIEIVHDHALAGSGIAASTVMRLAQRLIARLTAVAATGVRISLHGALPSRDYYRSVCNASRIDYDVQIAAVSHHPVPYLESV